MKWSVKRRMWGGRFKEPPSKILMKFTTRSDVEGFKGSDYYLFKYEVLGTYAHILMLMKTGIIAEENGLKMIKAVKDLEKKPLDLTGYEDIHSYLESKIIDETGLTPHICRSRNDQVILAERLFMRDGVLDITGLLFILINILLEKSLSYKDIVIPAYTHWRQADITTLSHIFGEYIQMLVRDIEDLESLYSAININPLGACAVAGCSLPIDREYTSILLGFEGIQENTVDVITSRWEYYAKYMFKLTVVMKHLSTISKDIMFLSADEIKLITLDDAFTTGSSILPHKKNPDPLELIIGKAGKTAAYLSFILSIGGDLSGYHRETQEGKWMIVDATHDVEDSIKILSEVIETMQVDSEAQSRLLKPTLILPELAHHISAEYGVSFRKIHELLGLYVRQKGENIVFSELNEFLNKHGLKIDDLDEFIDFKKLVKMKSHIGAPGDVERYIEDVRKKILKLSKIYENRDSKLGSRITSLHNKISEALRHQDSPSNIKYETGKIHGEEY